MKNSATKLNKDLEGFTKGWKLDLPRLIIEDSEGKAVCRIVKNSGESFFDAEHLANHIIKRVNSHETLVDAVKEGTQQFIALSEKIVDLKKQNSDLVAALQNTIQILEEISGEKSLYSGEKRKLKEAKEILTKVK